MTAADVAAPTDPTPAPAQQRPRRRQLFILATVVLSAWFLLPQLSALDEIWAQTKNASWPWALVAAAFSVASYLAATGSLLAAIPGRLAYGPALLAQIASSFANRITPAKVGGFATNIRYFQRGGVPVAVSATAVSLNVIAGVVMHVTLTVGFLLLASGDEASGELPLPPVSTVALVLAGIVTIVGLAVAVPVSRRLLTTHLLPHLQTGWDAVQAIVAQPARLAVLLGCSASITLCYLGAMVASLHAFGSEESTLVIGLLFLTGSAVANAAPTPGGLGGAEAALVAAFTTVETAAIVIPAVFLFRLVTFWLPILPGWLALTYLRSTDRL